MNTVPCAEPPHGVTWIIGVALVLVLARPSVTAQQVVRSGEPIARSGSTSVYLDEGGALEASRERWHLRVVDSSSGKAYSIVVPGTQSYYAPTLEAVKLDTSVDRLSLLFPEAALVVDLRERRLLAAFPGYRFSGSPDGRLLTFIEHYPKDAPPESETRRVLDVRALSAGQGPADVRQAIATGRVLRPVGTAGTTVERKWARQSATTWLSNDTLAFGAYDAASDTSHVVVIRRLPEQPVESVVDLDAVALVKDAGQARSAAEALRVQAIKVLVENPLRLRLKFREDYLLNARTLDVSVP